MTNFWSYLWKATNQKVSKSIKYIGNLCRFTQGNNQEYIQYLKVSTLSRLCHLVVESEAAPGMPAWSASADNVNHQLCGGPLPIVFFYPQQKTNGPHSLLLAEVLIIVSCPYEQQLQTMSLSGPTHTLPGLL